MRIPSTGTAATAIAAILIAGTTGCGPALHPFYTNTDLYEDPRIEGRWTDGKEGWEIHLDSASRTTDDGARYQIASCDPDCAKDKPYPARLFRIGGTLFLDFQEARRDGMFSSALYPHGVLRFRFLDADRVEIAALDEDALRSALEQKRISGGLNHVILDNRLLLTAPSAKLQQFLARHAGDPQIWGEAQVFQRDPDPGIPPYTTTPSGSSNE
jgi:hypothetical protein